jgi:Zn-dependent M16 (insulinase) family peptidase
MEEIHGFELLREQDIGEIQTKARLYRHSKTGAELLSLINDDENKVFGITFRTPPSDSTGVPHILEHSVLCGSRKYPVKEPFVEILKGSLQTFLNAFTYPDKTCYPVASQNTKDFYNLVDVYLDAVFYPRITEHIFQQEGWHFEIEKPDSSLGYKGVVFNEMKGAYSSPDNLLAEYSQQSLFPDTTYGLDSGGDPRVIPSLTYEEFRDFHRRYYHPSNSRIFFYGDDDPDERLRLAHQYLKDFEKLDIDSAVSLQGRFDKPRSFIFPFASGKDDPSRSKGMVTVNWLLTETTEIEKNVALTILGYILMGTPGSPLRKALIDSGLGEDVVGLGLEGELRQMVFSVGLKGIDVEKAQDVEALVLETLSGLAREGIEKEAVEAAINSIEFTLRENNTGSYPRGLVLMLRSLSTWLYGGDPLSLLGFEGPMRTIKGRIESDKNFFEEIIEGALIENPHRTRVVLRPDTELGVKEGEDERKRLDGLKEEMTPEELREVFENKETLQRIQETPDSREALASIPTLNLSDLEKENRTIPLDLIDRSSAKILYHDLVTNGIAYVDIGFNLRVLPQDYIPYIPLFSRALIEMGTTEEDYVKLSRRIDRKTGGVGPALLVSSVVDADKTEARLFLRGKAMLSQTGDLLDIIEDILLKVEMDNRDRFRQMLLEERARKEQGLIPAGHQVVNSRLRAHFSEAGWVGEQMSGVSYLFFLRELVRKVDDDWPSVCNILKEILRLVINRQDMIVNVTTDRAGWESVKNRFDEFIEIVPEDLLGIPEWIPRYPDELEGLIVPSQINYVGKGADLYGLGYEFHGSAAVITRYLRTSWLWDRIRVQGGAYGAFCLFDRLSGVLTFLSYRDPNIAKTVNAFDEAGDFLRRTDLNRDELAKSIIGCIGDIDAYMFPDAKGYTSMMRYLIGSTDAYRQKVRDEVLATTQDDFKRFADVLDGAGEKGIVKVVGSQSSIKEAIKETGLPLKTVDLL